MIELTLFVPIDYGSGIGLTGLSPATIEALTAACTALNVRTDDSDVVAFNLADIPALGMFTKDARRWKSEFLATHLERSVKVFMSNAPNSINEARTIRDELAGKNIIPTKIIIFCDRFHAMRLRLIWPYFFPDSEIEYRTGRYIRNGDYAQIFVRHPLTWALVNIGGMLAMRAVADVFGKPRMIRWFAGIRQP